MTTATAVHLFAICCTITLVYAQLATNDYYDGLDPSDPPEQFRDSLNKLISSNIHVQSYDSIWSDFLKTDENSTGCIVDLYTAICWKPDTSRCGYHETNGEGDCYNREHTWPQSWWSGHKCDATTDLTHIYPADSYVNGLRGNLPLGYVSNPAHYVSSNGAKIGECDPSLNLGFSGSCFEPADEYKGDLARVYFYMSVRYLHDFTCCDEPGVNGSSIKAWQQYVLKKWHGIDPVDDKETARNDEVYSIQNNRSPFVDHPEWVDIVPFNNTTGF